MGFTFVNSIELTFRQYKNMKMAIRHIATHFVVEGHKQTYRVVRQLRQYTERHTW